MSFRGAGRGGGRGRYFSHQNYDDDGPSDRQGNSQRYGAPAYGRGGWYESQTESGRRGGRGGRGRHNRRETHRSDFPPDCGRDNSGERRERDRPPPGLKGREIGMWYARRGQAKREKEQKQNRPTVSIDRRREDNIRQLLSNLQKSDPHSSSPDTSQAASTVWKPSSADQAKFEKPQSMDACSSVSNIHSSTPQTTFVYQESNKEIPETSEPPDSWEVRASDDSDVEEDNKTFAVEVVKEKNQNDDNVEEMEDVNVEPEWGTGIVQVMEYMKSHGDYLFMESTEQDTDIPQRSDQPALDKQMSETREKQLHNPQFTKMLEFRKKLPSYEMRETIVKAVRENQVLVISGETGCGKTTQVPQFILDDYIERGIGSQCRVLCTQPRRISAISVAERVANERCDKINDTRQSSVGYQIRLEAKRPRTSGSILFCTTGIVLKFLEGDPNLDRATHVVIDEIHERDLQSDFLMIILKDLLMVRKDLKVILMSATLNAEMFSHYFDGCPMLNIPGYTYPVKEFLLEDIIEMTQYHNYSSSGGTSGFRKKRGRETEKDRQEKEDFKVWLRNQQGKYDRKTLDVLDQFDFSVIDVELIHHIINYICHKMEDGAILVFVPGWEEIKKLHEMIQKTPQARSGSLRVIPLHSLMPTVNQREIFERPPPGVRKIVIATNIAETSITIDDVVFVIDGGKIKVKDFNPEVNLTSLEPQWVSKANAKQRRGRAGRVQAGYCFHLYTAFRFDLCQDYLPPEMLRTRLEELCLQIKLLKLGRIVPFISKAMQHPSMEAITRAVETLIELNALDADENLLPLGYHLARMPVEPHTGKMILFGAMFCCLDPILTVAASLSFKDAFTIPLGKEADADRARQKLSKGSKSDHIMLINAFSGWESSMQRHESGQYCWQNFLSESTLRMLRDMKKQLAELLYDTGFVSSKNPKDPEVNINSNNLSLIRAVLCAGLYPNVGQVIKVPKGNKRGASVTLSLKDESRVVAHPKSVNSDQPYFESKWLVFYYKLKTTKVYVHDSTMVSPYPLLFFGGNIKILQEQGQEVVSVDDWVIFKASASTAQLVKDLRQQLDKVLTKKITSPGPTSWDPNTSEGALMAAISDLLSTEDLGQSHKGQNTAGSIGRPPSLERPSYSHEYY